MSSEDSDKNIQIKLNREQYNRLYDKAAADRMKSPRLREPCSSGRSMKAKRRFRSLVEGGLSYLTLF